MKYFELLPYSMTWLIAAVLLTSILSGHSGSLEFEITPTGGARVHLDNSVQ
jgi:hypothetical protein